jgi:hypothetical protein
MHKLLLYHTRLVSNGNPVEKVTMIKYRRFNMVEQRWLDNNRLKLVSMSRRNQLFSQVFFGLIRDDDEALCHSALAWC